MKKHKKIIIISSVILIFVIVLIFIFIWKENRNYEFSLKKEEFIYELGKTISSDVSNYVAGDLLNKKDYIISSNKLELKDGDLILKNEEYVPVGKYEVEISNGKKSKKFIIKIVDTIAPQFEDAIDVITLNEGAENIDLKSYFTVKDYSDVFLEVKGDYNLNSPASYNLTIEAKDEYGNFSSHDFILEVGKKEEQIDDNSNENNISNNNNSVNNNNINNNSSMENNKVNENTTIGYKKDVSNLYVSQLNSYRKANGLSELPVTSEAQNEADRRAKELVTNYSHSGSGYGFGEIIGYGDVGGDFITAWKNSPSHNATILREQCTAIAASVYESNGIWYAVVVFKMNY